MKYLSYLSIVLLLIVASCKKGDDPKDKPIKSMDELVVSPNFNYTMVSESNLKVTVKDPQGTPIEGVRLEIYRSYNEETDEGALMLTGISNAQGVFQSQYPLENIADTLYLVTRYIGLPAVTTARVTNGTLDVTIGGPQPEPQFKGSYGIGQMDATYQPLCSYNSQGVPSCLILPRDVITSDFLDDVNAALPERRPVPQYNPHYLAEGNQTDLRILEDADVWITFVHEGAGYRNTIGFYTYDLNNPPTSVNQIQTIYLAFPNFSYLNSGGGLRSGDKVKLGTFPAGTGIGWVLIADGFQNLTFNSNKPHYYSNPNFNPESDPSKRQHNVLLYDAERQRFLISFEDINRMSSGCDNDFNDAIFYVTSNPITAIDYTSMPLVDPNLIDSDGDGVVDAIDDYPNDPNLAFNNYFPGRNQQGGLSFEDLWPEKGDYDFNDMVLSYNINQITNAQNLVAEIRATFTVDAVGAGFKNGFGFQLNIPPSLVQSVTGMNHRENFVTLSPNGTEASQSKAVIIPFDNVYNLFAPQITSGFINTRPGMPYVEPKSITVTIKLTQPQTLTALSLPPYNPFIIVNKNRGREVHLPGYAPTDKADPSLFGTADDDTNLSTGKYYKSKTNLPWGMHTPVRFDYPQEREPIIDAHLVFGQWVQSSGFSYMDWYMPKTGYRDNSKIYQRGGN
ncbi:MAG: LruC domain-containing protein [Bacteroidetes bacterium]|nr:LruC domain-containing protein [Bacteroidota bacterium]